MVEATHQDVSPPAALGGHLAVLASAPVALMLTLLVEAPAHVAPPSLPACEALEQRIELAPEPARQVPEVCLTPGRVTTFIFPDPLPPDAVQLEGAGQGLRVAQAEQFLTLMAGTDMVPGERRKLTVRFGDGAAPASAIFFLVVHPARAQHQVEVFRRKRTVESYQEELQAKDAEVQRCRSENAQLQAVPGQPDGLRGQLRLGLMGNRGVASERLVRSVTGNPKRALREESVWSFRSHARVALQVDLELHEDGKPWEAAGAALVDARGREVALLPLWQSAPLSKGKRERVVVEAEATPEEAQGLFTLTLWEAGGTRTVTLTGMSFPQLPEKAQP